MLQLAFFVSGPQPEKIMTEAILYVCWFIYLLAVFTFPFQKTKTSKTTKRKKRYRYVDGCSLFSDCVVIKTKGILPFKSTWI